MDIKGVGACGVIVVGGVAFGVSQYGLDGALSEELRHINDVPRQERPAYMDGIVGEFAEAFDVYAVETETYTYAGYSNFLTSPNAGDFIEIVTQEEPVPADEIQNIRDNMNASDFCGQSEMTMFTHKGWGYEFTLQDSKGTQVYSITCAPVTPTVRSTS